MVLTEEPELSFKPSARDRMPQGIKSVSFTAHSEIQLANGSLQRCERRESSTHWMTDMRLWFICQVDLTP